MTARYQVRSLPIVAVGALVVCLMFAAQGQAQQHKKGPPPDKHAEEAARKAAAHQKAQEEAARKAAGHAAKLQAEENRKRQHHLEEEARKRQKAREAAHKAIEHHHKALHAHRHAATSGDKLAQAEILGIAYQILADIPYSFGGQRAEAMHQIEHAVKRLDGRVMRHGSPMQKAMAALENQIVADAKHNGKFTPLVGEARIAAYYQLEYAAEWVNLARNSVQQHKEPQAREHLNKAYEHILKALKTP